MMPDGVSNDRRLNPSQGNDRDRQRCEEADCERAQEGSAVRVDLCKEVGARNFKAGLGGEGLFHLLRSKFGRDVFVIG